MNIEGVHIVPSNKLIQKWEQSGGVAVGCLLTITDETSHRKLLEGRGIITGKGEDKKLENLNRVRTIQDTMIDLAQKSNWLLIEQKIQPDPLEIIASSLSERGNNLTREKDE